MGKCDLCGQDAGFLRRRHKECEAKRNAGWAEMISVAQQSALSTLDPAALSTQLNEIAQRSFLTGCDLRPAYIAGWQNAVEASLEDGVLSGEEETALESFANELGLTQDELNGAGAYTRLVEAAVLRDVMDGKLPERLRCQGELPFNFTRGEKLVWVFPNTRYFEARTHTHYVGGMQGASFRVAKGVYYRVGGFRGHPVSETQTDEIGVGLLGVTDKYLYFSCPEKSFRIKYDKIVSFTPYSDGIGLQRDAQSAKPQSFLTGDGWFTYNLITNLAKGVVANS